MTTNRVPNPAFKTFLVHVPADTPVPEEIMKKLIEESIAEATKTAAVKVKPKRKPAHRLRLRNRVVRHAGEFPCRLLPGSLRVAAIIWPAGVPHQGCGRVFASEKMRDAHEAGYTDAGMTRPGWHSKQFPDQCLSRILPLELRDTK